MYLQRRPSGRKLRDGAILALSLILCGCQARAESAPDIRAQRRLLHRIADRSLPQTLWIVDRNGVLLAEVVPEEGFRTWVGLDRIPQALRDAVIATEDRSFYDNPGFDRRALARALLQNSQAGDTVSGASTLTMQVVRLYAFTPQERLTRTMDRKVREIYLAAELHERYSKDQILEAYLNAAPFGNRALGVEAAALRYFRRHVWELSTAECTLLAGLVQAPGALNPRSNPDGARRRQAVVLNSMVAAGKLSAELAEALKSAPLRLDPDDHEPAARRAPYFVDHLLQTDLAKVLGPDLAAAGGFTVTTTLDLGYQDRLTAIAAAQVDRLRGPHDVTSSAVVALRPGTGEILAMVGDIDYDEPNSGQVNMATRPRQLGSTFKPIGYAAALEAGWGPATVLWDLPHAIPDGATPYRPVNYDGRYRGPVRMRTALASSLNAAAIDVAATLGVEAVHRQALRMGLPLAEDVNGNYGVSLILGAGEVPLLDLTNAYAAIAAGGLRTAPTGILAVRRPGHREPFYRLRPKNERVMDAANAWLMSSMLSDAEARRPAFGDGGPLNLSRPAAVKTGTTNDFRDNATIGYTPYLTVGVWTGNKDNRPMRDVLGITGAAPIWQAAMEAAFVDERLLRTLGDGQLPRDGFQAPAGVVVGGTCDLELLARGGGCQARSEYFNSRFPVGDEGQAFGYFQSSGGACLEGGSAMVMVARPPWLSVGIHDWAARAGYRLAPPDCDGRLSPSIAASSHPF